MPSVGLQQAFRPFGPVQVEWPGKDNKHNGQMPKGKHLYIIITYVNRKQSSNQVQLNDIIRSNISYNSCNHLRCNEMIDCIQDQIMNQLKTETHKFYN